MATWMTLKELDGADSRHKYKGQDGQSLVRKFKYRHPFGLNLRYRHHADDHNNRRHDPISMERKWATKFYPGRNFVWYLDVSEMNTALANGHFRKGGKLIPTFQFRRKISNEMIENSIGIEIVNSGRPRRSTRPTSIVTYNIQKVKKHEGGYDKKSKNQKSQTGISKTEILE